MFHRGALLGGELAEPVKRLRKLALAKPIHLAANLGEHRHRGESRHPLPVPLRLLSDHRLRRRQRAVPPLEVRAHHRLEIVEIVEIDVVQLAHRRIDVARHGDVEDAERPVAAARDRGAHALLEHHRPRRGRGAEQQVDVGERVPRLLIVHRGRAVLRRQHHGAVVRPVRDDRRVHALLLQRRQRQLRHLAGAEHHGVTPGERAEDLLGELHRRAAHTQRAMADARLVAHAPRREQRGLEEPVEHRPRRGAAHLPRVAHLAMDLRLAHHHRVHARPPRERDARPSRGRGARIHTGSHPRRACRSAAASPRPPPPRRPRRDRAPCDCRWTAARSRARRLPARNRSSAGTTSARHEGQPLAHLERRAMMAHARARSPPWRHPLANHLRLHTLTEIGAEHFLRQARATGAARDGRACAGAATPARRAHARSVRRTACRWRREFASRHRARRRRSRQPRDRRSGASPSSRSGPPRAHPRRSPDSATARASAATAAFVARSLVAAITSSASFTSPASNTRDVSASLPARASSRMSSPAAGLITRTVAPASTNARALRAATSPPPTTSTRSPARLDQQRNAAHRNRPPPFVSAMRKAT